jgi:two-component system, chemotaxis family, chemotaxis protein CheY
VDCPLSLSAGHGFLTYYAFVSHRPPRTLFQNVNAPLNNEELAMQLKALVIDDSSLMRQIVMKLLTQSALADFEFVEAIDGVDALEKLSANEIDIAFVDWNMPNMTGIEFIKAVRSRENKRGDDRLPMIMVTSEKTLRKMEEAIHEAGADAFISKPFNTAELNAKISTQIARAGLRKSRSVAVGQAQPQLCG